MVLSGSAPLGLCPWVWWGGFTQVCFLFPLYLFIYYYVFKLFLQPFLLLSFNCPSSLNTCHLPGGRI